MKRINRGILIGFVAGIFFISAKSSVCAVGTNTQMNIEGTSYEFKTSNNYNFLKDDAIAVENMSFGEKTVGELCINGVDLSQSVYNGHIAFGVTGNISISYKFDDSMLTKNDDGWYIISDKEKKIADRKLDADILKGVLIIQKSEDGIQYEDVVNPMVNFFESANSGVELYKSRGEDISKGTYYRVILAYRTERKKGKVLWVDTHESKRHVERYEFYVVENSGIVSIHNISADEEILEMENYSQELLKKGETLTDGSVTRDGFEIEAFATSYSIKVQKDNESAKPAQSGSRYTADGKYVITVTTQLGKSSSMIIYVFSGSTDKGYSTYFGEGLVQAERIFRAGSFPTYGKGGKIHINAIGDSIPLLKGTITDMETNQVVFKTNDTRNEQNYNLQPGNYAASFWNSDNNRAGSFYQYNFKFSVLDEESAPCVNYHNLNTAERLADLQAKHYEVAYQTTGGGYVFVCFSLDDYNEALEYARDIEGRFVEKSSDGGFYYKDENNANRKIKYYDQIELTRVRDIYAKKNVEINYFNALDRFTYRTYDNDLLDCIEEMSISESIKVFPSQEAKDKLIKRVPFINNFTFIQASDYDVVHVEAIYKETGEVIDIQFGKPVEDQLSKSGIYTITETNSYGRTKIYDVTFLRECKTDMTWTITKDGIETIVPITANKDNQITIEADSAYVTDITNVYDEEAIVTIKAPDVYSFEIKCLASEFKYLEFCKAGEYEISFIDRVGNSYVVKLNISGNTGYETKGKLTTTYTSFYNKLYMNPKDDIEDFFELSEIVLKEPIDKVEEDEVIADVYGDDGKDKEDDVDLKERTARGWIVVVIMFVVVLLGGTVVLIVKSKKSNVVSIQVNDKQKKESMNDGEN